MKFSTKQQGPVTVITLQGNLMGGPDVTELNSMVHDSIRQGQKKIAIDLGKVEFMNSSGLSMLIGCASALKKAGGKMLIAGASRKVLDLIKITKLTPILETYPSVNDAVELLRQ